MIESKQNRCSTSAPPDILSRVVYDKIWHNPTATSNLLAFAKEHHCDENITFIQAVPLQIIQPIFSEARLNYYMLIIKLQFRSIDTRN